MSKSTSNHLRSTTKERQIEFMTYLYHDGFTFEEIAKVYNTCPSKVEAAIQFKRRFYKGGSTKDPEITVIKKIMEEAYLEGYSIKEIATYFQYPQPTMAKYISVKRLKRLCKQDLENYA